MDTCQYANNCSNLPYTGGSDLLLAALVVGLAAVTIALVLILVDVVSAMLILRREEK